MPIAISSICATVDNRGAPTALVSIVPTPKGYARVPVPVWIDVIGDMSDVVARVVTPQESGDAGVSVEGTPVFAWFPPNAALGRPAETLALAITLSYRVGTYAPRGRPAIGEVVGLDDLARALPFTVQEQEPELSQVAGEIRDAGVKRVIDDLDD